MSNNQQRNSKKFLTKFSISPKKIYDFFGEFFPSARFYLVFIPFRHPFSRKNPTFFAKKQRRDLISASPAQTSEKSGMNAANIPGERRERYKCRQHPTKYCYFAGNPHGGTLGTTRGGE